MPEKSRIEIETALKSEIIRWQSWLQANSGKYISQGRAAALACSIMYVLVDRYPKFFHDVGMHAEASIFSNIAEAIGKIVVEQASEGELPQFDYEAFFGELKELIKTR